MKRIPKHGIVPVFVLFSVLAWWFFLLVAWCTFGWAGVIVLATIGGLIGALVRSETARMERARHRADNARLGYAYGRHAAPVRRPRRGRGGVR